MSKELLVLTLKDRLSSKYPTLPVVYLENIINTYMLNDKITYSNSEWLDKYACVFKSCVEFIELFFVH